MSFELAKVATIYSEDPKLKKEDVDAIFDWLKTQQHLPNLTELQVILFLHSCYYELEAVKTTIETYFTLKTSSNLFCSPSEEVIRRTLAAAFTGILPKKTPEGDVIFLTKVLDARPENYVWVEQMNVAIMSVILYFHQHGPANGLIMMFDIKNGSLGHLMKCSVSGVKQFSYFLQEAAPVRQRGVHHVNVSPMTQYMLALVKPFTKKEIYNTLHLHTHSIETLYEYIPKECLPEEYGGYLPSLEHLHEENLKNLIDHSSFFEWHETQQVDESRRNEINKNEKGIISNMKKIFKRQESY